ncbi:hypothetical protein [Dinghuibacter silviterrae]|uniref:Uncharacterized protein n=1 Tax=Dinghuibacter silviterrae TaxID=1539049 RepID=A0A4R8DET6_9BACT|nr:hypothetical protein [Dinghuibacter silviterrae]TDW95955.1 hypothetical protein EDB95_3776 [Dinghuibacter silviterrae]
MEHTYIRNLLDKYWQAETSLEEEQTLQEYFTGGEVAPELEMYIPVFGFFGEVPSAPAHLQERVLDLIGAPSRVIGGPSRGASGRVRNLYRQGWLYGVAAVLVVCLAINLVPRVQEAGPPETRAAEERAAEATVTDTYDDPAQALAAVQNALRTVSARMNKGTEITASRMGRLSTNYRLAFKN